jgi:hypothetical protein
MTTRGNPAERETTMKTATEITRERLQREGKIPPPFEGGVRVRDFFPMNDMGSCNAGTDCEPAVCVLEIGYERQYTSLRLCREHAEDLRRVETRFANRK